MKFTKGYWMNLPGVENADVVQIRALALAFIEAVAQGRA